MNVLFIGPYRELGEWGRKSRALLHAVKSCVPNTTSRPLYMFGQSGALAHAEDAEFAVFDHYDAIIQFALPSISVYNKACGRNIGVFNNEMLGIEPDSLMRMNLLDEVWVDSQDIAKSIYKKLPDVEVKVLGAYLDPALWMLTEIGEDISVLRNNNNPTVGDRFLFYMIGSLDEKEGIREALSAYFSTFSYADHAIFALVLTEPTDPDSVNNLITSCKGSLGAVRSGEQDANITVFNPHPQEGPLNLKMRKCVHKDADCLVSPSYSLNISTTALEAACFGNTPILNKGTATYEALGGENCWAVDSYEEISLLHQRPFEDMFTCQQVCRKPIVKSLCETMREAYENKFSRDKKRKANSKVKDRLESQENYSSLEDLLCL